MAHHFDADDLITSVLKESNQAANDYALPKVPDTPTVHEIERYVGFMEGYATSQLNIYVRLGAINPRDLQGLFDTFFVMREEFELVKACMTGKFPWGDKDGVA